MRILRNRTGWAGGAGFRIGFANNDRQFVEGWKNRYDLEAGCDSFQMTMDVHLRVSVHEPGLTLGVEGNEIKRRAPDHR